MSLTLPCTFPRSLAGQAVCRHWRWALRDLPLEVCIGAIRPAAQLQWLLMRQPAVARLQLWEYAGLTEGLAAALLHSLPKTVRAGCQAHNTFFGEPACLAQATSSRGRCRPDHRRQQRCPACIVPRLQVLQQLEWFGSTRQLPAALPYPAVLQGLRQLVIYHFVWDDQWLPQLQGLPQLRLLSLRGCHRERSSKDDAEQ